MRYIETSKVKQLSFKHNFKAICFLVKHTNRKSTQIKIEPPDIITVTAPKGISDAVLLNFVESKAKWIVKKLAEVKALDAKRICHEYVDGELFLYLGRNYALQIIDDPSAKTPVVKLYQGKFIITTADRDRLKLKESMELWYRQKMFDKVIERVLFYQQFFKVSPTAVKVKDQKKRCASCSSKRVLLFNWRCTMAPLWVLDYIVVHEMAHMIYMNHSKDFWSLVERIMPDYKKRRDWLEINGFKMTL